MKFVFKYFVLCFLFFVNLKAYSQDTRLDSIYNPFKLNNFTLVYGNANFNIRDFEIFNKYKILLLTKSNGALFVLLDVNNLAIDTLFFKSAPANIKFWLNNGKFYYQSIFFYKSNLCKLDYKPGIASFSIEHDSFVFNECFLIADAYVRKELFQTTKSFKVTLLEEEREKWKKGKGNQEKSDEIGNIGFAVNEKYIVKRRAPSLNSTVNEFFPFSENSGKLYIYDIMENVMYKFTNEDNYVVDTIQNIVLYKDTLNSFVSYNLLSDEGTNELYLLKSQRIKLNRKGREEQQFEENQLLYKLINNKWEMVNYDIPLYSYKMRIHYKKIYSVFNVKDERGIKRKMLYVSNKYVL